MYYCRSNPHLSLRLNKYKGKDDGLSKGCRPQHKRGAHSYPADSSWSVAEVHGGVCPIFECLKKYLNEDESITLPNRHPQRASVVTVHNSANSSSPPTCGRLVATVLQSPLALTLFWARRRRAANLNFTQRTTATASSLPLCNHAVTSSTQARATSLPHLSSVCVVLFESVITGSY